MKNIRFYCIMLVIFVLCGVAAYSNILRSFFLSDDFGLIHGIGNLGASAVWSDFEPGFFRPLFNLSLVIDYKLWALNPTGYHFTSVVMHSVNSFLVFLISFLLISKTQVFQRRIWNLSLFSGFMFLVLPSHTEVVSWISGRADVIAAFFCLSSFCTYLSYKRHPKISYLLISLVLFVCALFSKESVVIYPFVILSYEIYSYIIEEDKNHKLVHTAFLPLIYCILLGLYLLFRYAAMGTIIGVYGSDVHLNFELRRIFCNLILLSARAILPPMPEVVWIALISTGITAAAAVVIFNMKRRTKPSLSEIYRAMPKVLCFLVIAFVISLLPVINLPASPFDIKGERFIYLPSAFSSIFIIFLFAFIIKNRKRFVISFICLLLFLWISLYRSNRNWSIAGEISKNILTSLETAGTADRLYIINLPDNINGAYIYRNGIQEAIRLFGNAGQFKNITVISYNSIYKIDDTVEVTGSSNKYSVRLADPEGAFLNANVPVESTFVSEYYEIVNLESNGFDFRFKKLNSADKLTFYSAGRMVAYEL